MPDPNLNRMDIDLDALDGNLAALRTRIGPEKTIIASLKANAYGHDIVAVGQRLAGGAVAMLATGSLADAVRLRNAGVNTPILMFATALPPAVAAYRRHDLIATIHNRDTADAVAGSGVGATPAFVKVDCGLGRLGIPLLHARDFIIETARRPGVEIAGLYSHLPFADDEGCEWARLRTARFDDLLDSLERDGLAVPITQIGASASIMAGFQDRCTAVCPGGILYGYSPFPDADMAGFRPVLSRLATGLIQISPDAADRTPGYEGRFANRVTGATGVVPFGRLHGNRASLPDAGAYMIVRGVPAPVLGVSLEHSILDLSDVPGPEIGDEAVIVGEAGDLRVAVEDIAAWWGAGVNDVLMAFNDRVERRFVNAS